MKKIDKIRIDAKKIGFGTLVWEDAEAFVNESIVSISSQITTMVQTFGIIYEGNNCYYIMTHFAKGENCDFLRVPKGMVKYFKIIEDLDEDDFFIDV